MCVSLNGWLFLESGGGTKKKFSRIWGWLIGGPRPLIPFRPFPRLWRQLSQKGTGTPPPPLFRKLHRFSLTLVSWPFTLRRHCFFNQTIIDRSITGLTPAHGGRTSVRRYDGAQRHGHPLRRRGLGSAPDLVPHPVLARPGTPAAKQAHQGRRRGRSLAHVPARLPYMQESLREVRIHSFMWACLDSDLTPWLAAGRIT